MRLLSWIAAVAAACGLAGCFDAGPKLSQDEEKLLDAATYLFTGLEDNLDETDGKGMPWRRTVNGRSTEYWRISTNGIGFSSDELNKKTRPSKYVRYVYRVTSAELCVFTFANATELSKGDSQQDFSAFSSGDLAQGKTFNLGNAHTFQVEDEDRLTGNYLRIVGPRVVCDGPDYCENAWNDVFSNLKLGRFRDDDHWERRKKALAIIKKACPGKEF